VAECWKDRNQNQNLPLVHENYCSYRFRHSGLPVSCSVITQQEAEILNLPRYRHDSARLHTACVTAEMIRDMHLECLLHLWATREGSWWKGFLIRLRSAKSGARVATHGDKGSPTSNKESRQ
jgi:hypothetical protein